jgi:ABC-type Na+ efflux pump permease subunit
MSTSRPLSPLRGALEVARKELTESLRDRATVIYAFVLPICMYPVLFWAILQGVMVVEGLQDRTETTLGIAAAGVPAEEHDRATEGLTHALSPPSEDPDEPAANSLTLIWAPESMDMEQAREWLAEDSEEDTEDAPDRPDAVLFLDPLTILHVSTKSSSNLASKRARSRLEAHASALRQEAADGAGLEAADLDPISVSTVDLAERGAKGAVVLASLLPLLLVVMAVMGSFFPAVDLTAGEKERGTAETTLLVPLARSSIITGKVLAVGALAMTATALSLFALSLSAEHILSGLPAEVDISISIPTIAVIGAIPLAFFFSLFVSAVLTACASLAATFKEGQALLGPVQMVFILPAMVGIIPGIQLTYPMALIPVINVVLAFRAMLMGQPLYGQYCVTALALAFYAWLALRLALHLLSRESVLLAGKTLPLGRLLKILRGTASTR